MPNSKPTGIRMGIRTKRLTIASRFWLREWQEIMRLLCCAREAAEDVDTEEWRVYWSTQAEFDMRKRGSWAAANHKHKMDIKTDMNRCGVLL